MCGWKVTFSRCSVVDSPTVHQHSLWKRPVVHGYLCLQRYTLCGGKCRDLVLKKTCRNASKKIAILKQLKQLPAHFKAKREKGVGTPLPRVHAPLHPWANAAKCNASNVTSWYFMLIVYFTLNKNSWKYCEARFIVTYSSVPKLAYIRGIRANKNCSGYKFEALIWLHHFHKCWQILRFCCLPEWHWKNYLYLKIETSLLSASILLGTAQFRSCGLYSSGSIMSGLRRQTAS